MNIIRSLAAASICILLSSAAWAIDDEHSTHHPDAATSSSKATKVEAKTTAKNESKMHDTMAQESMEKMDSQMKVMNDMHEKMMNAKTPDERKALMAEHMKAMQGGMAMMRSMSNHSMMNTDEKSKMQDSMKSDMATHHKMMEKRMQMMVTMMQMMMDRMTQ